MATSHYDKIYVKEGKHEYQFDLPPGTTVGQLKEEIAAKIILDTCYFNLIAKGKILAEGSLNAQGLKYGAKVMITKTEDFHVDKPQLVHMYGLSVEVSKLEAQAARPNLEPKEARLLDELLTGMMEKIDAVDTMGRPNLRATRKKLVLRCEAASALAAKNKLPAATASADSGR